MNKHDTGRWLVLVRSQKYTRSKVVPLNVRGRRRCEDLKGVTTYASASMSWNDQELDECGESDQSMSRSEAVKH